ncbi:MAG: hypothetical protein M0D53_10150 [Flavobacterium sp. JAD_PAG50586_2]|nr:MAG: hypothetical protein M0D53_10150 [Flavobacterium sp. JAD_PAG50586_2]
MNVTDIYDLRRLYILKIFEKIGKRGTYINLSEKYSIDQVDELIKDNVFQEIINQSSISYIEERYNYGGYVEMGSKDSKVKVEQIDKEIKYFEKADLIANKKNNEVDKYNKRIQSIKVDINAIRRSPIAEVLKTSNNVEDINEELRKSDVLIYLIRRGFIAEDYFDYISIFYDITTTRNDKNFILSIRDNKPLPIDFKLNKVEALVKKIKGDYGNEASLNIDLVDFILMKEENDSISILFQQFNNNTERTNNFIETYLLNGKYVSEFINSICALYEGFWDFIENSNLTDDDKDFVFKGILLSANNLDIVNLNKSSKLSNYISKKTDFLNLINETSKKVEEILLQLNVKFKYPLDAQANKELYDFIYQNSLYEINENVIEQVIIEQSEENIVVKDLKKSNYTTILNSKCSQLITYINQNISIYINNVFLKIDLNVEESEKNIIGLLNNKILTDEDKFLIIDKEDFVINQLDDIDDNLISIYLIQKDKVKPTWENIIRYCGEDVFDDKIINYLNKEKHYSELSKNNITDEDMEDDFKNTFIHNLITANSLTNEAYKSLLQIIDETIDEINFELLGEDKIEILVRMDFIELNEVNMEKLRKDSAHKQVTLVELNFEKYIKQRDDDTVDDDNKIELTIDEIELLLSSPTLVDSNKIQLISEIEESQVTENLGNLLSQILIRNTLISISFDFLNKILKFSNNLDNKIRLCNLYSNMFLSNRTSIESVLNILGDPFSNIVLGGVKPPISSSQWNLTFIENLKKAGYIISYSVHDGKITKIRKNLES